MMAFPNSLDFWTTPDLSYTRSHTPHRYWHAHLSFAQNRRHGSRHVLFHTVFVGSQVVPVDLIST
jgi:hypothetical protein